MTGIGIKAKKGDAIVIETKSSATNAKTFKVTHYSYFKIARCAKADRQGRVILYETPTTYPTSVSVNERVICIGDPVLQDKAKALYAKVKDNWFDNREDIKKAILEA
jgi:hypothetical protein